MREEEEGLEPLEKLTRDLKRASTKLGEAEVRSIVDLYYLWQDTRIRAKNQQRASLNSRGEETKPHEIVRWLGDNALMLERQIHRALGAYSESRRDGRWLMSVHGIGPVISAGMLAHIDITKAPTAGAVWRFAGLDPTARWEKGQKRPWNARLKVICWKAGESFKKFSDADECFYGHIYRERKALEVQRNAEGLFAEQAARSLTQKDWKRDTATKAHYQAGQLPSARLDLRATRYAVKLLLAHLHHVMHEVKFGTPPPKPYVIEYLGHTHIIGPPGWPCE